MLDQAATKRLELRPGLLHGARDLSAWAVNWCSPEHTLAEAASEVEQSGPEPQPIGDDSAASRELAD